MRKIYYLKTCSTSLAVIKETGIDQRELQFIMQNIKEEKITAAQLEEMKRMTGNYEQLFSRRAQKYKERDLKNKKLGEKDYRNLILEEYTFLKRPVVIIGENIYTGSEKTTVRALKDALQALL